MVWTEGGGDRLAPALLTLLYQLEAAYPGDEWVNSPQTGSRGDIAHQSKDSDHNAWLNNTVRALDVAVNVSGVAGITDVSDGPSGKSLLAMWNAMYAARDPRVWPDGYGIFDGRITDPAHPGQTKPYRESDQHHYHFHGSVSTNPAGYESTRSWPLIPAAKPSSGTATKIPALAADGGRMFRLIRNVDSGAVRACGPNYWAALEGATRAQTLANIALARTDPLCTTPAIEDVSTAKMLWLKRFYTTGKVAA